MLSDRKAKKLEADIEYLTKSYEDMVLFESLLQTRDFDLTYEIRSLSIELQRKNDEIALAKARLQQSDRSQEQMATLAVLEKEKRTIELKKLISKREKEKWIDEELFKARQELDILQIDLEYSQKQLKTHKTLKRLSMLPPPTPSEIKALFEPFVAAAKKVRELVSYKDPRKGLDKLPDYSIDFGRVPELLASIAETSPAKAKIVAKLIPHIRYIPAKELLKKIRELAIVLTRTDQDKVHRVFFTPTFLKSNFWVTALFSVYMPIRLFSADTCENITPADLQELAFRLSDHRFEVIVCDDCVYSGEQMTKTIKGLRSGPLKLPNVSVYAVAPFVHNDKQIDEFVHPAVRELVRRNSAGLFVVSPESLRALDDDFQAEDFGIDPRYEYRTTLTYLQTKMPDLVSFPKGLLNIGEPGSGSLIKNCDRMDTCPPSSYLWYIEFLKQFAPCPIQTNFKIPM